MVQLSQLFAAAAVAAFALVNTAVAHPGQPAHQPTAAEHAQRKLFMENGRRSLAACANQGHVRELQQRALERRSATIRQLRQERAERRRLDAATVLATSHKSNLTGVNAEAAPSTLFGDDVKCILEPEVTQGPYYVNGELIRNDIREKQAGVDLYTELQIIDVNTCKPVADLYVDFWHCNSTGVYSGVVARGNGDQTDLTNINNTFGRGLAPTNDDGLVTFVTTFPGHYIGRATHIHILGSHNGTVLPNNTYVGGLASHVGQIFFDQDLITEVERTPDYVVNTQALTTNAEDSIFAESADAGFDPVVEYALLGDSVADGIFSWISVGIDATVAKTVGAASTITANGGVKNEGFVYVNERPGGNGPRPSGPAPTPSSAPSSAPAPAC